MMNLLFLYYQCNFTFSPILLVLTALLHRKLQPAFLFVVQYNICNADSSQKPRLETSQTSIKCKSFASDPLELLGINVGVLQEQLV